MKKLLLTGMMLCGMMAIHAQTLSILDKEGNPIPNGSTYIYQGYEVLMGSISAEGTAEGFVQLKIDPELTLVSSEDDLVTITAESLNGTNIELCAGGQCVTSAMQNPIIKNEIDMVEGSKLGLEFAATAAGLQFQPGQQVKIPYYEAKITAYSEIDEENSISFIIKMGDVSSGVKELLQDKETGNQIYDLKGNKVSQDNAEPGIYIINGKKVLVK